MKYEIGRFKVTKDGRLIFQALLCENSPSEVINIPTAVVAEGEWSVELYVREKLKVRGRHLRQKRKRLLKKLEAVNEELFIVCDGVSLLGRLVNNPISSGLFTVQLEKPEAYADRRCVYGSLIRAKTTSLHWFDEATGTVNQWAIEEAKVILVRLYKDRKFKTNHAPLLAFAEKLNKTSLAK